MFESIYLSILIAGFGGGVVRSLVGFIKHQHSCKNVGFNLAYSPAMRLGCKKKRLHFQKAVSVLLTVLLIFQIISGVFLFVPPPKQVQAATQTWSFTTASNYTYDNTKIEISSGQAQLKATSTPDWYNANWGYRRAIAIDNTGNANNLTNYQVKIELTPSNFDYSNASPTGADIRFTDTNGTTTIDYWIEEWNNAATSTIWVEVPSISASSTKTIYMYYGNSDASSTSSGDDTFLFFDDDFVSWGNNPLENAATYQTTPTYDGSNEAVHPDIVYFSNAWNGYKYWMLFTPYPSAAYENPSILASNDSSSWEVPSGLTNPIDPAPASGHNADTDMIYNDATGELWAYYIETGAGTTYLKRRTSSDGVTWSAEEDIFNLPDYQIVSPSIVKVDSTYYMWYVDSGSSGCSATSTTVKYRTSSDGVNWSSAQDVNITQSGYIIWHLDVIYVPSKSEYWMLFAAYPSGNSCSDTVLFFAKSTDRINWTTYSNTALDKGSGWDENQIYRSSLLYDSTNDLLKVWYSANGASNWRIGYTERNYTDFLNTLSTAAKWTGDSSYGSVSNGILTYTGDTSWRTFHSTQNFGPGSALRSRAKFSPHSAEGGADLGFRGLYQVRFSETYDAIKAIIVNDGTPVKRENQSEFVVDSYATWDIFWEANKATFKVNGNECTDSPIATNIPTSAAPVRSYAKNVSFYIDWILVRKYADPEPSTSVGPEVTIYASDNPTIQPAAANSLTFTSLSAFTETATKNGGEIKYQISNDAGTTWYWWDGSNWTTTTSGYSEANIATEINDNISTFPTGDGKFLFKAFLHSDGTQLVQLDNIEVIYGSNTAPFATFDNDFSTWESGDVTVNYNLIDADSDTCNISQTASSGIEYSIDGSTWYDATDADGASEGLTGLTSTPSPGTDHVFVWDSATDLPNTEDGTIYLRIRPNDGIANADSWATSAAFGIDNVAPSSVGAPSFGTITTSSIEIIKPSTVTENGSGLYQWQVRRDNTTELGFNTTSTTTVVDSSLSENTPYTYDVQFKDNAGNISDYGTSATKYTLVDTPTNLTATTVSTNRITLSVDSFPNDTSDSSGYYFENTTTESNSGWIQTNSWQDTGLSCGTSYTYTVKYRNGDGIETNTISLTRSTNGCGGVDIIGPPISTTGQGNVYQNLGGEVRKTFESGKLAKVVFPPYSIKGTVVVKIEPRDKTKVIKNNPLPQNAQIIGDLVANFKALSGSKELEKFEGVVPITFTYTDEQIEEAGVDEKTLKIYWWEKENKSWKPLKSKVDTLTNKITAYTSHFSLFAVVGEMKEKPIEEMTKEEILTKMIEILKKLIQFYAELIRILKG